MNWMLLIWQLGILVVMDQHQGLFFSNVSDIKTIFYEYTKTRNERHMHVLLSSELTFEKKVL